MRRLRSTLGICFGLLAARLKPKRRCVRPRAPTRRSRKLGTIFPTYWTSKVAQKPQSIVCGARSRLPRTTPTRCLILRFCYSEVVGTRKRRSAGGNILPMMLNLNGEHAHVDPRNSAKFKFICQRPEKQPGGASVDRRNGRQDDARPCFARRPVALLRRLRLDFGSPCFWFGLFALGVAAALEIAWEP